MRSSLERDLARWERGELSPADLALRHPARAAGIVALYQRLTDIGAAPVPDPALGWERLRERLPQRADVVHVRTVGPAFVLRRLVARPLALAAALVLLGGAIGYAAAPQAVNHRLSSFWESVEDLFRDEPRQGGPDRTPGDDEPGLAPSVPDDEEGDDGDGDESEDREDGDDGDDREDEDDDDREGPSEDSGESSGSGDGDDETAEPSDGGSSSDGPGDGSDEGSGSDGSSFEEEADETSLDPDAPVEPDD